ncbi:MAG: efflux RND transporter periplasmic adaptor subunit [Pseudomonadota bacterium]
MAAALVAAYASGFAGLVSSADSPPAKGEVVGRESELLRITLSPDAERRLGLTTVSVAAGVVRSTRSVPGEIVTSAVRGGFPVGSAADLASLGANQARADADLARTLAERDVAQSAFTRAEALVKESAGSVRVREEAAAALAAANANLRAAQAQRALLGQSLSAMSNGGALWVRAAAFAADISVIDRSAPATVRDLNASARSVSVSPVAGPPSANAAGGTLDLYYAIAGVTSGFQFGQRVIVELPLKSEVEGLSVPDSAVLRDIYGGEWVYVRVAPNAYERRRVEIAGLQGRSALVSRGLSSSAEVVNAGAMELFGYEFGVR